MWKIFVRLDGESKRVVLIFGNKEYLFEMRLEYLLEMRSRYDD